MSENLNKLKTAIENVQHWENFFDMPELSLVLEAAKNYLELQKGKIS